MEAFKNIKAGARHVRTMLFTFLALAILAGGGGAPAFAQDSDIEVYSVSIPVSADNSKSFEVVYFDAADTPENREFLRAQYVDVQAKAKEQGAFLDTTEIMYSKDIANGVKPLKLSEVSADGSEVDEITVYEQDILNPGSIETKSLKERMFNEHVPKRILLAVARGVINGTLLYFVLTGIGGADAMVATITATVTGMITAVVQFSSPYYSDFMTYESDFSRVRDRGSAPRKALSAFVGFFKLKKNTRLNFKIWAAKFWLGEIIIFLAPILAVDTLATMALDPESMKGPLEFLWSFLGKVSVGAAATMSMQGAWEMFFIDRERVALDKLSLSSDEMKIFNSYSNVTGQYGLSRDIESESQSNVDEAFRVDQSRARSRLKTALSLAAVSIISTAVAIPIMTGAEQAFEIAWKNVLYASLGLPAMGVLAYKYNQRFRSMFYDQVYFVQGIWNRYFETGRVRQARTLFAQGLNQVFSSTANGLKAVKLMPKAKKPKSLADMNKSENYVDYISSAAMCRNVIAN